MKKEILRAAEESDSVGGILETAVLGVPAGAGEPYFDSLESVISHAVFSVPAIKGIQFGGIGLTQSFALELCAYNIKVNAVCPGNFLDGPLWSDPVRGLFVQYLEAGKVPGAKTVADVRRYYEAKVPMNRGCLPIDVARAVMYCVEQKYETGQAIPVTGGQVMLN